MSLNNDNKEYICKISLYSSLEELFEQFQGELDELQEEHKRVNEKVLKKAQELHKSYWKKIEDEVVSQNLMDSEELEKYGMEYRKNENELWLDRNHEKVKPKPEAELEFNLKPY